MPRLTPVLLVASLSAAVCAAKEPLEERIDALVAQMTVEEKLGQMSQLSIDASIPGVIDALKERVRAGTIGSTLNINDPVLMNEVQRIAVTESRLKIPLINGVDVIHGYRTQFPIPLGQACSWNPELVRDAAAAAAREAKVRGVHWAFAPMIDIARDARWGRIAECPGEDPFLTSAMGVAMVQGFQGEGIAACAKHYAGYGAAEAGRDYNTTLIPETELRNVYLKPFHAVQKAGVLTYMSAFNDLNGVPASANRFLMRQVLREEWGFTGFVVSDWEAVKELISHGIAGDMKQASALGINAGVDMEMVSTGYVTHGGELVKNGLVAEKTLDESVRAILRVKAKLGLLDNPYWQEAPISPAPAPETRALARKLATQSLVLLKNSNGRLPLVGKGVKVAVVGPLADSHYDMLGCWACQGRSEETVTVLDSMRALLGEKQVSFAPGLESDIGLDTTGFAKAVSAAKNADVIVACIGEGAQLNGEARSRASLDLPGAQQAFVDALAATGKPLVLVIFSGRPLVFDRAAAKADAVLWAFHGGYESGNAIADVLFGREAPSGKLTVSFPRAVGQIPTYYNHRNTGRPSSPEAEKLTLGTAEHPTGYVSKHFDLPTSPAYPFGFGLTYSTFEYSNVSVSALDTSGNRQVTATLKNTGKRAATEIAQLYVQDVVGSITRPVRELKGFTRVTLEPGASTTVTFDLPKDELGFYNTDGTFVIEPGVFRVWVGGDSTTQTGTEFTL